MSLKRFARRVLERALAVDIIPRGQLAVAFEREHLRRFFARFEVDCVFDVGANAGQYARMLRERVGYRGPIISYEPIPELAQKLRTQAKGEAAWFIEELALGEEDGEADLNIYAINEFSSLHGISPSGSEHFPKFTALSRRVSVKTATLQGQFDHYQSRLGFQRAFLKMDTQGHDLAVANGAHDRLKAFIGLQSELALTRLYSDAPSYHEALEYYARHGFELSALVPNNLGHFPRLFEIDCIMFRSERGSS